MIAALLLCSLGVLAEFADLAPQQAPAPTAPLPGPGTSLPPQFAPILAYPEDTSNARFAPFLDAQGQPERTSIAAAGAADFDGDGNQDLWFLAGSGARAGQLATQMARTSSLGRFRDWYLYPALPAAYGDAATYRSITFVRDQVLLAQPGSADLAVASYYAPPNDPRRGTWQLNPLGWTVGLGARVVRTRDDDGDGHDDILVLLEQGGLASLKKLRMGTVRHGYLAPETEVALPLPLPASTTHVTMLDVNGDGLSDFAATIPGAGVLVCVDGGQGAFVLHTWFAVPSGVRALCAGDVDGDGNDDLGLCCDPGVALLLSRGPRLVPVALWNPPGVGALGSACITDADADGTGDVVAIAADQRSFAVHPWWALAAAFGPARAQLAPATAEWQGPGVLGLPAFAADVDNDLDLDLLLQLPSGAHWATLRAPIHLAPMQLAVAHEGKVGETGFIKERFTVTVPAALITRGLTTLEMGVFLRTSQMQQHAYWGRLSPTVDLPTRTATFLVYFMVDPLKLPGMIQTQNVFPYLDGITAGGDVMLTVHAKSGTQRFESLLIHHPQGDENKSTLGVKWQMRAAPPLPAADADLLPWN